MLPEVLSDPQSQRDRTDRCHQKNDKLGNPDIDPAPSPQRRARGKRAKTAGRRLELTGRFARLGWRSVSPFHVGKSWQDEGRYSKATPVPRPRTLIARS